MPFRILFFATSLDHTSQVDFLNVLSHGSVGLGLKAGGDFQRETVRIFRVTDSFSELANMPSKECDDSSPSKDYAYPIRGPGSTDRRNTGVKSLCWGFKLQGLTWPFVELTRHFVQMGLRVHRQVGALGEVLSQQTIGVLI